MTIDELKAILDEQGIKYDEHPIQHGTQIRCKTRETFNVYNTGKVVVGGKKTALTTLVENATGNPVQAVEANSQASALSKDSKDDIFIVYGHDTAARDELELLLRRMGLNPIILGNLAAGGDTIIEKLESYLGQHGKVGYACVLLTPDDEGHKAGMPDQKKYRARQNVVLELGMVLSRLGRKRVAILRKKTVEQPSDIDGLIYIAFDERVEEIKMRLFNELSTAGYKPRTDGI